MRIYIYLFFILSLTTLLNGERKSDYSFYTTYLAAKKSAPPFHIMLIIRKSMWPDEVYRDFYRPLKKEIAKLNGSEASSYGVVGIPPETKSFRIDFKVENIEQSISLISSFLKGKKIKNDVKIIHHTIGESADLRLDNDKIFKKHIAMIAEKAWDEEKGR